MVIWHTWIPNLPHCVPLGVQLYICPTLHYHINVFLDIVSLLANQEETSFAKKLSWVYWFKSTKWQHKEYWENFLLLGVIFWFITSWKQKSTKDLGRQIFIFGMCRLIVFIELPIFHTWHSRNNFLPPNKK